LPVDPGQSIPRRLQRLLRRYLPSTVVLRARRVLLATRWFGDGVPAGAYEVVPPRHLLDYVGGGDFAAQGQLHRDFFVQYGQLAPSDRVLDVGCGIGRMALPLTTWLAPEAGYDGFDIVRRGIDWCRAEITPRYPNFHFAHADIRNRTYNPRGRLAPEAFAFPYADAAFDFQFSTSVFTHMRWAAVNHYLSEIARTLRPGGRCLNTFFVLDPLAHAAVATGRASQDFRYELQEMGGRCWTVSQVEPEKAIAFDEDELHRLFDAHGLDIVEPILYGNWCGRPAGVAYQDMVVAVRRVPDLA
jgi:SAM-dependent methyltransferase